MIYLESILIVLPRLDTSFPFSLPIVKGTGELALDADVTIFVGENGSGKSTILEGIAAATKVPTIGAKPIDKDETMGNARKLGAAMKLHWKFKPSKGFFLRAEDFFSFVKQVAETRAEMEAEIHRVDVEYRGRSKLAQDLAKGPFASSLADMTRRYGSDLDANSHGESFLKVFQARFVPGGLYLLDEPETPLSPTRQLAFIAMMRDMIKQGCQFVIATHSPIIMAYPGARILDFDQVPPKQVPYEDLEHVRILKAFLDNPDTFIRRLDTDLDD